jgi:alpha-N-arabinofuranosidase
MSETNRRDFMQTILASSASLAGGSMLGGLAQAQTRGPAKVLVNASRKIAPMDPRLMGAFLEHLGRSIYGGIYEPGSPLSDENGFRKDVIKEMQDLQCPIMRYPGGNFVSGYDWLHGVGPKKDRPSVLDRAWNSQETNQFGTNEFIDWCKLVGTEPLLATNLGTGTPETSAALVEYCNVEKGTRWADLRREHGYEKPHNVKYWCVGNEMDGWWQIGHMPAREYGRKARDAGRQIRGIDPSTQLIACGSSGPFMPTYLVWDRETLEECYPEVDGLSLHRYYGNTEQETGKDSRRYLALNLDMEQQIKETLAVCDYVGGLLKSPKKLWLSFDEWNVWYRARSGDHTNGHGKFAPNLLEEVYNLEDALLVGGMVNTLLRQADRVKIGCLAQIINVIAALVTNKESVLRQTIYYPYAWGIKYAKGTVLDLVVESETYPISRKYEASYSGGNRPRQEQTPYLDVSATHDPANGNCSILILNRDLDKDREVEIEFRDMTPTKVLAAKTLTGKNLQAANTFAKPANIVGQDFDAPSAASKMTVKLPARSYSVLQVATS